MSSRGEGPSGPKGKSIDPREWGNINISHESLDIEAQTAALNSFKVHPKEKDPKLGRNNAQRSKRLGDSLSKRSKHAGKPAESQPSAQIAPKATWV